MTKIFRKVFRKCRITSSKDKYYRAGDQVKQVHLFRSFTVSFIASQRNLNTNSLFQDDASTISAASSRSRSNSESSVTSVSSKSSAASDASSVSKASSKSNNSNKSSASEAGDTASLVQHSASEKGSTASLIDHSSVDLPPLSKFSFENREKECPIFWRAGTKGESGWSVDFILLRLGEK